MPHCSCASFCALLLQTPSVRRMSSGSSDVIVMPMSSVLGGTNFRLQVSAFNYTPLSCCTGLLEASLNLRTDEGMGALQLSRHSLRQSMETSLCCRDVLPTRWNACLQVSPGPSGVPDSTSSAASSSRSACMDVPLCSLAAKSPSSAARAMLECRPALYCKGPTWQQAISCRLMSPVCEPRVQAGAGGSNAAYTLPNASAAPGRRAPMFSCQICS